MAASTTAALLDEYAGLMAAEGLAPSGGVGAVTADDVVIVVDMQNDFLPGGAFGVAEGDATVAPIVRLINEAAAVGAPVFATRDYHPADHCSFAPFGGVFPPHCVQNSAGSKFQPTIGDTLAPLVAAQKARVVFKGFSKDVDSFGAFPYADADVGTRVLTNTGGAHCGSAWTGSFVLYSSTAESDVNAPPDVMAVLNRQPLADAIGKPAGRVLVCGLALDYCVLDTAVNAAHHGLAAHIVLDASRAAHIPGVGTHGSGFLTDPKELAAKVKAAGVGLLRGA